MIVAYDLTPDDYFAFIEHLQPRSSVRFGMVKIGIMLFVGMVLPFWIIAARNPLFVGSVYLIAIMALGIFACAMFYMYMQMLRMGRTLRSEDLIQAFCGHRELTLDANGLIETSRSNRIVHLWNTIEQVARANTYLFIHSPQHLVTVIPSRAFSSEQEFNALAETIAKQTGKELLGKVTSNGNELN